MTEHRGFSDLPHVMTGDYKRARGALPRQPGEPRAEERISDGRATRNRAAKLTGDCETDCVDGCAYPGQFSECELGDAT